MSEVADDFMLKSTFPYRAVYVDREGFCLEDRKTFSVNMAWGIMSHYVAGNSGL